MMLNVRRGVLLRIAPGVSPHILTTAIYPPSSCHSIMDGNSFEAAGLIGDYGDGNSSSSIPKSNAISHKLASILSTSFANTELRDVLRSLDEKGIQNTPETRRRLRLDAQKEVIDRNGDIIRDFGHVAEVGPPSSRPW